MIVKRMYPATDGKVQHQGTGIYREGRFSVAYVSAERLAQISLG
jgi:hypothetical protein